jgi:hypothetical protein
MRAPDMSATPRCQMQKPHTAGGDFHFRDPYAMAKFVSTWIYESGAQSFPNFFDRLSMGGAPPSGAIVMSGGNLPTAHR